jgi:spermidine synthase
VRAFAAKKDGVLADTGAALAARYRERGIESPYFDPLWFEGASDFLDPAKRAQVERALAAQRPAHLNTDEQPAAAIYHMRYWATTSEAAHAGPEAPAERRSSLLEAILALRFEWAAGALVAATAAAALAGLARGRRALGRTALLWSVGTTGFAGMAVEIVLLYTFQTLYGYVYGMVGLVVGVFMFGLVAGSFLMNRRLGRVGVAAATRQPGLRSLVALDLAVTAFAAGLVLILAALRASSADWPVQLATFGLVAAAGVLGGLVYPIAACVRLGDDPRIERVAGAVSAADSLGACAGALVTGVALVPVLGISGTLVVVVTMKALSAALVSAGATVRPAASA